MAYAAGTISLVQALQTELDLVCTAASGGTSPYTYQWYRSTVSGFTPGGGNILAGKTALTLADTGLLPGTQYYYVMVATDTGNSNATANSVQFAQQTLQLQPSQNQFKETSIVGVLDMRFDYNTIAAQIDVSQVGALGNGAAVKMVDSTGGVPKVVGITAATDEVLGFIVYDIKTQAFNPGDVCQLSIEGNVQYMMATAAIARGAKVIAVLATFGGVAPLVGSGAADIVGWALDKASAAGDIIRVFIKTPYFGKDGS